MTYDTINDATTLRGDMSSALGCIDQYELLRELGGGGFGSVYLARDTVAGIEVAVKGLPPIIRNNAEELERIRENFALISRLHHPYIAAALHLHRAQKVRYSDESVREKLRVLAGDTLMVMEYAPGVTLSKWRKQFPGGKVPLEQAIQLVRQIAQALDYAHEQHIIHRDIKPSNVIVETKQDGEVVARLLDFGLAAEIRSSMGRVSREIRDTSGTRPYMAPEQWAGDKQGPATDQYALAALFCELVTGDVPFASVFETNDPIVMLNAVRREPYAPPPDMPKTVRTALAKALAKDPEKRFTSCTAFVDTLTGTARRSGTMVRRVLLVAAALALVATGGWWLMKEKMEEPCPTNNVEMPLEQSGTSSTDAQHAQETSPVANTNNPSAQDAHDFVRLKASLNLAIAEAKEKASYATRYAKDPEGFESRLASIGKQWKMLSAMGAPADRPEAEAALTLVAEIEGRIDSDLKWLESNKEWRDAVRVSDAKLVSLINEIVAKFDAEKYAAQPCAEGHKLHADAQAAFKKGDFAEAERILGLATERFATAARTAKVGRALEYKAAARWDECQAAVEQVLKWDSNNAVARALKKEIDDLEPWRTNIRQQIAAMRTNVSRVAIFRDDPDGFKEHLKVVDGLVKTVADLHEPRDLAEAKRLSAKVTEVAAAVGREADWLARNKPVRDATRARKAEIAELLDGDFAMYKAYLHANGLYDEGMRLLDAGDVEFRKGNFAEADRLFVESSTKLTEAANQAKARFVTEKLATARACMADGRLDECLMELDDILLRDRANADARQLRIEVVNRLAPRLRVATSVDGHEVMGAKVNDGVGDHVSPVEWKLDGGKTYGPYKISYESDGKRYVGTFDAMMVDWRGIKQLTVEMKEYVEKTIKLPGGETMTLIYCGPGSYVYGPRNVPLKMEHGFWLGKYEVTQRQWKSVMGWNPSRWKDDDLPVESLSWNDCQSFIHKVNASLGCGARLPTEHEWEYACRAGTSTKYDWGDSLNGDKANCDGMHPEGTTKQGPYKRRTTPVGSFSANPWGFYDMHGNVWEWCSDDAGSNGESRVLCGGSWYTAAGECSAAARRAGSPQGHNSYDGFRLACSELPCK